MQGHRDWVRGVLANVFLSWGCASFLRSQRSGEHALSQEQTRPCNTHCPTPRKNTNRSTFHTNMNPQTSAASPQHCWIKFLFLAYKGEPSTKTGQKLWKHAETSCLSECLAREDRKLLWVMSWLLHWMYRIQGGGVCGTPSWNLLPRRWGGEVQGRKPSPSDPGNNFVLQEQIYHFHLSKFLKYKSPRPDPGSAPEPPPPRPMIRVRPSCSLRCFVFLPSFVFEQKHLHNFTRNESMANLRVSQREQFSMRFSHESQNHLHVKLCLKTAVRKPPHKTISFIVQSQIAPISGNAKLWSVW